MVSRHSDVLSPVSGRHPAEASRWSPWIRRFAWLGIAAQVVFVAGVLVAASWQGPHYSVWRDSISDMYAVTAPHGSFLAQLLTDTGAATILFALLAVWPALRSGGRSVAVGSVLHPRLAGLGLANPGDRHPDHRAHYRRRRHREHRRVRPVRAPARRHDGRRVHRTRHRHPAAIPARERPGIT